MDSSPFESSQQTAEGELYAGNAQSSSRLTAKPVAYLLCSVMQRIKKGRMGSRGVPKQTPAKQFYSLAAQLLVKTME